MIHEVPSPSAVLLYTSTNRMPLVQLKCLVRTSCGVIPLKVDINHVIELSFEVVDVIFLPGEDADMAVGRG